MRRKKKKQVRMIIYLSIFLLLVMTTGYAAFSTNLTLNIKGNIVKTFTFKSLINNMGIDGNGLFEDLSVPGRYIYRGTTPENYIELDGEIWRILAIETDGTAKIIKQDNIGRIPFDKEYARSDSTYCPISSSGSYGQNIDSRYGCNAWTSENGSFVNGTISGTLNNDAYLNTYLNNDYYNSLGSKVQKLIQKHDFYYGGINSFIQPNLTNQERAKVWNGNIGLINLSDYQKASLEANYCNLETNCLKSNYIYDTVLNKDNTCWTMDILLHNSLIIRDIYKGKLNASFPKNDYAVYPVMFLRADLLVYGNGTKASPFKVKIPS